MTNSKPWLHVALFLATCGSTFVVGLGFAAAEASQHEQVVAALQYAGAVMAILLAHEMGHYVMARWHGVDATLPFFIPVPLGFGTMGAVIRLKGRIPSRNALVDIGAAGPLAGLVVAIPLLVWGVWQSKVGPLPEDMTSGMPPSLSLINLAGMLGLSVKHWLFHGPAPVWPQYEFFGDNLLSYLVVRVVHGEMPPGKDLFVHPVFLAAWFGMVVTMLNLLPIGQLDGGHLTHAWYGTRAEAIGRRVAGGALIMAMLFSASWLIWFLLATRVVGVSHPAVEDELTPLSRGRRAVVLITWVMTALTFMPIPISMA